MGSRSAWKEEDYDLYAHMYRFGLFHSIIVTCMCITAFGFSKNYYLSVGIRFLHGCVDGTLGLGKTMIVEISNSRNIALGSSFCFLSLMLGKLLGPLCGNYLSKENNIQWLIKVMPIFKSVFLNHVLNNRINIHFHSFLFHLDTLSQSFCSFSWRMTQSLKKRFKR